MYVSSAARPVLTAGFGVADFTPSGPVSMGAFPERARRRARQSTGVAAPLRVRALMLGCPEPMVCLAVADVCLWQRPDVNELRQRLATRPEMAGVVTIPIATHTHASIESTYQFGGDPRAAEMERLRSAALEAVRDAHDDMAPAAAFVGAAQAPHNHNRRVYTETGAVREMWTLRPGARQRYVDPTLTVLRLVRTGAPPISLIHWAAHPLCLGRRNTLLSPDFPGALLAQIESAEPGVKAVYVNGAAGDVNPHRCLEEGEAAVEWLSEALGSAYARATTQLRDMGEPELRLRTEALTFVNRVDPQSQVEVELGALLLGADPGSLAIALVPGEPFAVFQRWLGRTLAPRTALVFGYAGASVGYMPPRSDFDRGGYGIDPDAGDPAAFSRTRLRRGVPEQVFSRLAELLRD